MTDRRCSRCSGIYDEIFFRRAHSQLRVQTRDERHHVCIGCEQTGRDETKRSNRPLPKARRALRTHARTYIDRGHAKDEADFARRYGWEVPQMAHDIEHAAANGCPYCRKMFATMAHGLADVTLDILDPQALPFYRTNIRWGVFNLQQGEA